MIFRFDNTYDVGRSMAKKMFGAEEHEPPENSADNQFSDLRDLAMFSGVPYSRVQELAGIIAKQHELSDTTMGAMIAVRAMRKDMRNENEVNVLFALYSRMVMKSLMSFKRAESKQHLLKLKGLFIDAPSDDIPKDIVIELLDKLIEIL